MKLRGPAGAILAAVLVACAPGDGVDPEFDPSVAVPAFAGDGPRVLFDEAHRNWHRAGKGYRPFVRLLEADGYRVTTNARPFTPDELAGADILVIVNAVGASDTNDDPAFTIGECDAVAAWVAEGGALLLVTDHFPTGHAAEALAARFGVEMSRGQVEDPTRFDASFESTHIVFAAGDGLVPHPITEGRDPSERLERVLTFTGQALRADPPAVGFLALSPAALARPPRASVERRGADVIVNVEYGDPSPAAGWAQGVALEHGRGRVVILGEAAMLTARLSSHDGRPIGMNTPGYDNRQLVLNLARWLARGI